MKRLLLTLYDCLEKRRRLCIGLLTGLVLCLLAGAWQLKTSEDISDFLPADERSKEIRRLLARGQESGRIIFMLTARDTAAVDPERSIEAMEMLVENLDTCCGTWINDLFFQIDAATMAEVSGFVSSHLPYFLTEKDYDRLDSLTSAEYMRKSVADDRKRLLSAEGMLVRNVLLNDPLHFSAAAFQDLQRYSAQSRYETYNGYLFSDRATTQWLIAGTTLSDSRTGSGADFAAQLHKAVDNTLDAYGGDYDIQWFSAAEVAETNAARIKTDSLIALGLSLLFMLLLLWSFFHHFKALLVIVSSVGFGGLFAMALLGISGHTVSMIAVGAGSVILGIAIDYALHFITHYKFSGDARTALSEIIQPLTVGSLTTIAAFLSLLFIQAPAMRDLGLFAALALIGTILFVLVFLPHFMPRQAADWRTAAFFRRVADFRPERHLWLTVTVLGATLLLACFASRMRFDTDLQHINYMTPQQRHAFERVQAQTAPAPNSCLVAVRGNDMDEALQRYEQLDSSRLQPALQGGDVAEVLGVSRFLPSEREQRKRLGRWLQWCDRNGTEVTRQLQQSARAAGFKHQAFGGFTNQITNQCELLSYESFAPLTATLLQPYVVQDSICYVMAQVRCSSAEQLKAFMDTLPPEVTAFNPSSVMRESIGTLSADFDFVLWVCGGIVFVFLLLSFRRAETALISFLPMSVSWIWILGLMGCMQVPFNVVNIILATFIFGLGDDYAIFMMDGLIQEYSYGTRMLGIHKNAVLLSVLTLLAGIGTLVFAAHPAMRSLADVTFIGMLSVLLITYVLPPLLFHGLATRHQTPVNLQRIGYSIVTETFFVSSALLLSLWAALFFLLRRPTEARRLKLHQTMYRVTRFIIRHIPGAPFTLANPHGETFDRPAVIYANHQSRLDLMAIIGLTPKLVILTNDQVWNNPFYGRLIRHAEFYPVSKGFNEMLPKMRSLVQRGYSVVIFPEGTRSADCRIGRFHQGAWQLARELRIDLLPLVLHGFGHVLPKKNLMLRKGALHLEVGRRQPWPDDAADPTCRHAAKKARRFLTDELKRIGQEREDAAYWFPYVRYQYYYKDPAVYPILHRYSQRLEMLQQAVNEARRQSGYRTDTDDYGIRALIVALCVPDIQVTAEEGTCAQAFQMAAHLGCIPSNLHFIPCRK